MNLTLLKPTCGVLRLAVRCTAAILSPEVMWLEGCVAADCQYRKDQFDGVERLQATDSAQMAEWPLRDRLGSRSSAA